MLRFVSSIMAMVTLCYAHSAAAATYSRDGDMIGNIEHYTVKKGDSLYAIARHFDIGIGEMQVANPGVSTGKPIMGTVLTISTAHILPEQQEGIVINLAELRLYYFVDATTVMTFPIGIGREGWLTPLGTTTIVMKRRNPVWTAPASILAESPEIPASIAAGPDNPMGAYAMNLGWINYAIHGTNQPNSIGKRASHGCMRLYPEDIDTLFHAVATGTSVTVIDAPFKLGWQGNHLMLEVIKRPMQGQADQKLRPTGSTPIDEAIKTIAQDNTDIDQVLVDQTIARHDGIPTIIGEKNGMFDQASRTF